MLTKSISNLADELSATLIALSFALTSAMRYCLAVTILLCSFCDSARETCAYWPVWYSGHGCR